MTPHTAIDNDILEVYHKADSSIRRIVPALFIPHARPLLLNILVLCILGAYLPSAQAMSDGSFPGKGSKAAWSKANKLSKAGTEARLSGNPDKAIQLGRQAIAAYPHDSIFYYNLGNAYADKKDFKTSDEMYRKAAELEPRFYSAWYNLGINAYDKGNYQDCVSLMKKALSFADTETRKVNAQKYIDAATKKKK
jgi:tetratricopeptide (TPR) repeat protein